MSRLSFRRSAGEVLGDHVALDADLAAWRDKTPAQLDAALDVLLSTAAGQRRVIKLAIKITLALWLRRP